jgi:hypothetical protein
VRKWLASPNGAQRTGDPHFVSPFQACTILARPISQGGAALALGFSQVGLLGRNPQQLSMAQALRAFRWTLRDYLHPASSRSLDCLLRRAIRDQYPRQNKASRDYPRKNRPNHPPDHPKSKRLPPSIAASPAKSAPPLRKG